MGTLGERERTDMKNLYIAEKPSVAQEFAKALHEDFSRKDGYLESDGSVVTWCVGHLITMSYPEVYDPKLNSGRRRRCRFCRRPGNTR